MSFHKVTQSIRIEAEPGDVWDALIDPQAGEKWRDAHFTTDWRADAPIEIEAVIGTKRYRDKGRVIKVQPPSRLQYTHWSRVSGLPDTPQSRSTITITLQAEGADTLLTIEHQAPPSPVRRGNGWEIGEDSGWKHAAFYWRTRLPVLKRIVEAEYRGPERQAEG
jgi:uncharacterized protein YndB with AHSA1/START domain